jgi:hypothetical protein
MPISVIDGTGDRPDRHDDHSRCGASNGLPNPPDWTSISTEASTRKDRRWQALSRSSSQCANLPADAQARAADAFTAPASAVGLRLTERGPGELKYQPLVEWPLLVVLWRNLTGEKMAVRFEPADDVGTRVRIDGAVGRAKQPLAADPEHWTIALDGSAV